jgi:hypothetical protein
VINMSDFETYEGEAVTNKKIVINHRLTFRLRFNEISGDFQAKTVKKWQKYATSS